MIRESHEVSRVTNTHPGCRPYGAPVSALSNLTCTHISIKYQVHVSDVCGTLRLFYREHKTRDEDFSQYWAYSSSQPTQKREKP